jgi:hypothetical protein
LRTRRNAGKAGRLKDLEEERANAEIARRICELRTAAGLTELRLAKTIGTTASVICRLEDADYEGHSLGNASQYRSGAESAGRDPVRTDSALGVTRPSAIRDRALASSPAPTRP